MQCKGKRSYHDMFRKYTDSMTSKIYFLRKRLKEKSNDKSTHSSIEQNHSPRTKHLPNT